MRAHLYEYYYIEIYISLLIKQFLINVKYYFDLTKNLIMIKYNIGRKKKRKR